MTFLDQAHHNFIASNRIQPMALIELSMAQTFEVERLKRDIEAQNDPEVLCALVKDLLRAWFSEKASTNQAIQQQLNG